MGLLTPFSFLFGLVVRLRNTLYHRGVLKSHRLPVRVVSVGNLSVGGTGKTSFVIWLLKELHDRGVRAGVLSRGYGGRMKTSTQVPVDGDPHVYGDEPCLIAREYKGPVYVGPDRVATGLELLKSHSVDVVIADDAFQHRRLYRDMDVVLIDFSEPAKKRHLLPRGRLREGFSALKRAQVVVETKRNFSEEKDFSSLEKKIPSGKLRLKMEYVFIPETAPSEKHLLVSGVAKPGGVEVLARSKVSVCGHLVFGDHFDYTKKEVTEILKRAEQESASWILTTEKDAVKLRRFPELHEKLKVMKLDYAIEGAVNEFFEKLLGKNI